MMCTYIGVRAGERKALLVEILLEERWERTADLWGALAQASNLSATENRPALFRHVRLSSAVFSMMCTYIMMCTYSRMCTYIRGVFNFL